MIWTTSVCWHPLLATHGAQDIGAHRDSTVGMIEGAPIVTLSLGEERIFRMRPWKGQGYEDFVVGDGDLLVIPFDTNQAFTHEVPKFKRYGGKRISVTARGFTRNGSPRGVYP